MVTNRTGHVLYQQKPNEQRTLAWLMLHSVGLHWIRGIGHVFHFWAKDIQKNGSIDLPSGYLT